MKQFRIYAALAVTAFFCSTACSQKAEQVSATTTDSLKVSGDSAAIAAEKKKAAETEKAKLPKPYVPTDDAEKRITEMISIAGQDNKNIIMQAGGNWCIWCLRFNNFLETTPELKKIVDDEYLYYHLNYSPENKNEKIFARYGNPGDQYGYPVLLVLDKTGKLIHTQETGALEEGKGYSVTKVKEFLEKWKAK